MNKQPHYHWAQFEGKCDSKKIREIIASFDDVLEDTIEIMGGEILFTATDDLSYEIQPKIEEAGVNLVADMDAEPGDPADLM